MIVEDGRDEVAGIKSKWRRQDPEEMSSRTSEIGFVLTMLKVVVWKRGMRKMKKKRKEGDGRSFYTSPTRR